MIYEPMKEKENKTLSRSLEIGLYTIGDLVPNMTTGKMMSERKRLHEIVNAAKLADEAGLDVFGVGESHQRFFATAAHTVVLGAIAAVTKHIRLASSSSVISYTDPVRLFEDFSTIDLLSDGRAEIIAGRGSRAGGYHLFGYDLQDYDALFDEKIQLLLTLNRNDRITWSGQFRTSLDDAQIYPRPLSGQIPIWIAVGGTPESSYRAGSLGVSMALAALGGPAQYFKKSVDTYRQAAVNFGHTTQDLQVAITNIMHIEKDSQEAMDTFYPYYSHTFQVLRGSGVPRSHFDAAKSTDNVLLVGSPAQIVEKILHQYELFGLQRVLCQIDIGGMPFSKIANTIERLATDVAPVVRKHTRGGLA